jgi:2-(1,2-epoxy-1,2-dihydrophenyl)acetyl-CoA isomerase
MHDFVRLIKRGDKPVIALVNGVAAGGGWSLALACDHILAADTARFVTAFTRLGLVPDLAGAFTLTHRIGATRAKSIVMRGQTIDAATALAIGAVDWVAPADQLEARFHELLPQVLAMGKR